LQVAIHLELSFPCKKRIEFLDSLVEKFITHESSQGEGPSLGDKEEVSSMFCDVIIKSNTLLKKRNSKGNPHHGILKGGKTLFG
jgi:hypothetical protein